MAQTRTHIAYIHPHRVGKCVFMVSKTQSSRPCAALCNFDAPNVCVLILWERESETERERAKEKNSKEEDKTKLNSMMIIFSFCCCC